MRQLSHRGLKLTLAVFLTLAGGTALWACAPFLSNWLLGEDGKVLEGPSSRFAAEIARLVPDEDDLPRAVVSEEMDETAQAEAADLSDLPGTTPERRQALAAAVRQVRQKLVESAPGGANAANTGGIAVPAGLPGEIADYLEGAIAYRGNRFDDARRAWERLLARPAAERRRRAVWAAYMLGRLAVAKHRPEEAVRRFAATRELARKGFADRLGLAAASLGWEARAELDRGRFARAAELYLAQQATGDAGTERSLRITCQKALAAGRPALREMARSPLARRVMTACVITPYHPAYDEPHDLREPDAAAWLAAVEKAGVTTVEDADRLAWAAYLGGDFAAARRWVDRAANPPSAMARWIRAKLLLREGRLAEAAALLPGAARDLPPADMSPGTAVDYPWQSDTPLATGPRASGEAGVVELSQGHYTEALDHLLAGAWWVDAAYVAERVMTTDELRAYVDRGIPQPPWQPAPVSGPPEPEVPDALYGGLLPFPHDRAEHDLRYLLGRRLAREGRYAEARPYFPAELEPRLDALAAGLREGQDPGRPAAARARALLLAACTARHQGLELLGTEIEPDWRFYGGELAPEDVITGPREGRAKNAILRSTADERRRARASRVRPFQRFHYRYQAAGLARQAAALLPDGTEEKARLLATAGSWLKARDPEAALPFYRELVRCCGETPTGRAARQLGWFPPADACPAPAAALSSPPPP